MKRLVHTGLLLAAAALGGCSHGSIVCTTESLPAVIVEIRDVATGAPIAADARGSVREGAYLDSLRPSGSLGDVLLSRSAADERPGTYTVEVVHEGYVPWQRTGLQVSENVCHVETETVQAQLEPLP